MNKLILADGRWRGTHGIGRFTHEILSRLNNTEILDAGPSPLSITNLSWQPYHLYKNKHRFKAFFNPGFNPILYSAVPYTYTIHDLTHLFVPGKGSLAKKIYYESLIKTTAKKATRIFTVSDYSKNIIIEWAKIPDDKIIVVGNGISQQFTPEGHRHQPGYSYLLHVGNSKTHKNISRLIEAFAIAKINPELRLILTANQTPEFEKIVRQYSLEKRVIFSAPLSDEQLAEYYRGASAFIFPSLSEGFGIPVIEAMACGTPTVVANATSLPEVAGDAAIYIDPYSIESLADGIEKVITDEWQRINLIRNGFERVKLFSWNKTAGIVQGVMNELLDD